MSVEGRRDLQADAKYSAEEKGQQKKRVKNNMRKKNIFAALPLQFSNIATALQSNSDMDEESALRTASRQRAFGLGPCEAPTCTS